MNKQELYEKIVNAYWTAKATNHDDWEQKFFDQLWCIEQEYNKKNECSVRLDSVLLYYDDDTSEISRSLLDMLENKRLLYWNKFYDESRDCEIIYTLTEN